MSMELDLNVMRQLLDARGWSEVILARQLGLDYSYVYRIMRKERGIGKKFITEFMKLCEREDLEFKRFVTLG